jgi:hypothetical protein
VGCCVPDIIVIVAGIGVMVGCPVEIDRSVAVACGVDDGINLFVGLASSVGMLVFSGVGVTY